MIDCIFGFFGSWKIDEKAFCRSNGLYKAGKSGKNFLEPISKISDHAQEPRWLRDFTSDFRSVFSKAKADEKEQSRRRRDE